MDFNKSENLDETIAQLLQSEPLRSVPSGFGRKVKARVTLAALLDCERQRSKLFHASAGFLVLAIVSGLMVVLVFPQVLEWGVEYFVPGGAGYFDYLVSITYYGGNAAMLIGLAATVGIALAVAFAYGHQRKSGGRRSWMPIGRS